MGPAIAGIASCAAEFEKQLRGGNLAPFVGLAMSYARQTGVCGQRHARAVRNLKIVDGSFIQDAASPGVYRNVFLSPGPSHWMVTGDPEVQVGLTPMALPLGEYTTQVPAGLNPMMGAARVPSATCVEGRFVALLTVMSMDGQLP